MLVGLPKRPAALPWVGAARRDVGASALVRRRQGGARPERRLLVVAQLARPDRLLSWGEDDLLTLAESAALGDITREIARLIGLSPESELEEGEIG